MTKLPPRVARIATAALIAGHRSPSVPRRARSRRLAVTGPAAGVNATSDDVHVLNVMLVDSGSSALAGRLGVASQDDTLVSVSGVPIKADGSAGQPFGTVQVNRGLTAGQTVNLDKAGISLRSPDLVDGLTAAVTFTFSHAGTDHGGRAGHLVEQPGVQQRRQLSRARRACAQPSNL